MKNTKFYTLIIIGLVGLVAIFSGKILTVLAAPPVAGNLIVNPDMQIAATSTPANWQLEGFTDTFTGAYPVPGPGVGDKAAQIITTIHNGGDAKWVFDNVPVSEGALYTFSDSYNSTATSSLIAAFTATGGTSPTLFTTMVTLAPSNSWQNISQKFTIPLGYSSVTVYHAIVNVGTLTTANYSLVLTARATDNIFSQGMVSLTFDDGWSAQYDNALPILKNANMPGTFYIVSQAMQNANNTTADNLLSKAVHPDVTVGSTASSTTWSSIYTDPTNKTYRFTDFYASTQPSTVEVGYQLTGGLATTTVLGTLPAAATSTRASFLFTLPGNPTNTVSPITVTHSSDLGNLNISTSTLTGYDLYMNTAQVQEAQAAGIEIGSHTVNHCNLVTGLCPDAVIPNSPDPLTVAQEISNAKATLLIKGFSPVDTFAYPYGAYSTTTQSLVSAAGIAAARSVNAGFNTKYSDKLALNSQVVDSTVPLSRVYQWIDSALNNKWWLVLVFHQIEDQATINANNDTGAITPQTFASIVSYLNGAPVKTLHEGAALVATSTPPAITFTITSSVGSNGTISPLGPTTVNSGTTQAYMITPNSGYQIQDVLVDGVSVGAVTSYTFSNVTATHAIAVSFTVIPPIFTSINLAPLNPTITANSTQQFTATTFDQNNATTTGVTLTWSSSNPVVATIDQTGLATGLAAGTTTITALNGLVSTSTGLTVIPPTPVIASPGGGGGGGGVYVGSGGGYIFNSTSNLIATAAPTSTPPSTILTLNDGINLDQNNIGLQSEIISSGDLNALLLSLGKNRNAAAELKAQKRLSGLMKNWKLSESEVNALNYFVAYGTSATQKLGSGERAGVLSSYLSAYGKLPSSPAEWSDVIKISLGIWPSERNLSGEAQAMQIFKKIYNRAPDSKNTKEQNAIMIITYGLRPNSRNLASEKKAVKIFQAVYGHRPSNVNDQNIVRAIAYSSVKRNK
jgi:peptidoglycan/xylan/chitin deacetylase (PgdA/CDA1 family)